MRVKDGNNYLLVGSKGGAPTNPVWVHNLRANPNVKSAMRPWCGQCGCARSWMRLNVPSSGDSRCGVSALRRIPSSALTRQIPLFVAEP